MRRPLLYVVSLLFLVCASADDYVYVMSGAPTGGDGSQEKPFGSIGEGFDLAASFPSGSQVTIYVAPGKYAGPDNYGLLMNHLNITSLTFAKSNGITGDVVVDLTGNNGTAFIRSEDRHSVLTIQDFTFQNSDKGIAVNFPEGNLLNVYNCVFQDNGWNYDPSESTTTHGLDAHSATVDIENCIFSNNMGAYGAGLFTYLCKGNVTNCSFTNNTAFYNGTSSESLYTGGGAAAFDIPAVANFHVNDCVFSENVARLGGAVHAFSSLLSAESTSFNYYMSNNTFTNNQATEHGGALYSSSDLQMTFSTFTENNANQNGGAVYFGKGSAVGDRSTVLSSCTFEKNEATHNGGAAFVETQVPINLEKCTLTQNQGREGGAIYLGDAGTLYITASHFYQNSGHDGGAIFTAPDAPTILAVKDGCTFDSNEANQRGGAILVDGPLFHFQLSNSNFMNNVAHHNYGGGVRVMGDGIVNGCTFVNNSASIGGGLSIRDAGLFLVNGCSFENNSASRGAGMDWAEQVGGLVSNSHFSGNVASSQGGGVWIYHSKLPIEFANCEWKGNTAHSGNHIYLDGDSHSNEVVFFRSCTLVPVPVTNETSHYDFYSVNATIVMDKTCSLNELRMTTSSTLALCGCEGSMSASSIDMSSGAIYMDETLSVGHFTWRGGLFGYVPLSDCTKGALHFVLNQTEETGAGVVVSSHGSIHGSHRLHSYGLNLVVGEQGELNITSEVQVEGGGFINYGKTFLEDKAELTIVDANTLSVNNVGELTMLSKTVINGNLVQSEEGTLYLQDVLHGEPAVLGGRFQMGGSVVVPTGDEDVFRKDTSHLLLTWNGFAGELAKFVMDTHSSDTAASPEYSPAGLYASIGKPQKEGMGAGGAVGLTIGILFVCALIGGGVFYTFFMKKNNADDYGLDL